MSLDNRIFEREAADWWSDDSHFSLLRTLVPPRLSFLEDIGVEPEGTTLLDVGCGGGLFAEALAESGFAVTGVDPSPSTIGIARAHAAESQYDNNYVVASGESLPFGDEAFDVVCCCDVLEHVDDVESVVRECSRVMKSGGVFLFDTINRTWMSKLFLIDLFQNWNWTRLVPPELHEHARFIKPQEMREILQKCELRPGEFVGLAPDMNPLRHLDRFAALWKVKRGAMSCAELGERVVFEKSRSMAINYMGFATKTQH